MGFSSFFLFDISESEAHNLLQSFLSVKGTCTLYMSRAAPLAANDLIDSFKIGK